jgi:ribosomal protein S3
MKRCETDDLNDASIKRCRSEPQKKFELRLLISTKAAGAVIGRGGDYIKMLREMVRMMQTYKVEIKQVKL